MEQGKPAQPKPSDSNIIVTEFATMDDTYIVKTNFLVEPYLPRASVVGFYGRGEPAKSSLIATMCAYISHFASTLWISSEEYKAKIRARHVKGRQARRLRMFRQVCPIRSRSSRRLSDQLTHKNERSRPTSTLTSTSKRPSSKPRGLLRTSRLNISPQNRFDWSLSTLRLR